MRILIAGGQHEADYIIKTFKEEKHQLVVINSDLSYCRYLSKENHIKVINADPTSISVLIDAGIQNCDLVVALCLKDEDNFVICQIAKNVFAINNAICTVTNPKNVELFRKLGVNSAVSSAALLLQTIKSEANFENVVKSFSLEHDKIAMIEIKLTDPHLAILGKTLAQLDETRLYNISCIYRDMQVVIPSGNTEIKLGDKLFITTTYQEKDRVVKYIQKKKSN